MYSKIYKARLVSQQSNKKNEDENRGSSFGKSIHTKMGMVQHIFKRNINLIKEF
jgi:hypothetical protein